jgi:hypothetical protein
MLGIQKQSALTKTVNTCFVAGHVAARSGNCLQQNFIILGCQWRTNFSERQSRTHVQEQGHIQNSISVFIKKIQSDRC